MATGKPEGRDSPQESSTLTQQDLSDFRQSSMMVQEVSQMFSGFEFDELFGDGDLQPSLSGMPELLEVPALPMATHVEDDGNAHGFYFLSNTDISQLHSPEPMFPQHQQVTVPTPTRSPFPFMELPPELRNAIYDLSGYSTDEREPEGNSCNIVEEEAEIVTENRDSGSDVEDSVHLAVRNGPWPGALQVSRQFRAEYAARIKLEATWIFTDRYVQPIPLSVALNVARAPHQIQTAHFRLLSGCVYCQRSEPHGGTPATVAPGPPFIGLPSIAAAQAQLMAQAATAAIPTLAPIATAPGVDIKECEIEREIGEHMRYIQASLRNNFKSVKHYTIQLIVHDMHKKCTWPLKAGNTNMMPALDAMVGTSTNIARDQVENNSQTVMPLKESLAPATHGGFQSINSNNFFQDLEKQWKTEQRLFMARREQDNRAHTTLNGGQNAAPELRRIEIVCAKSKNPKKQLISTGNGIDDLKDFVTHARWTKKNGWVAEPVQKKEVVGGQPKEASTSVAPESEDAAAANGDAA